MRTLLSATLMASTVLSTAASLGGFLSANAQEADAPAQEAQDPLGGTIRSIVVEGNQRIEDATIASYLLVQPGSSFSPELLDLSFKTLFSTELFADVNIGRRGDDLVITVVENPIINRVLFEGNRSIDDDTIREEIQAEPRGVFTLARVQSDVRRIVELYRAQGRFGAEVTPQYKLLDQSRVDLIFEVAEGPTTGVRSINFIGNDVFSDARLRSEVVTKQSRLWRFFSSNDNYDPDRLQFDQELLRQFYQNQGYYDFQVTSADAAITPDQEAFYITFTVNEGKQYNFGEIKVDTELDKLDEDRLTQSVQIKRGDLYRGDQIEEIIEQLTAVAGISGYAFVDVIPRIMPNPETGEIDITFALDEGPRVYIERINIVGNTRTLDPVVRRRLTVSEGDAFNRVSIDRSRGRVLGLGYFGDVTIEELPGSEADRASLDIAVEEQATGELSASVGFSSIDNFLIDLAVSERNLLGRGIVAGANISASSRSQNINFRYQEPQFLGRNLAAGLSVFAQRSDFSDVGLFQSETIGAQANVSFPVTRQSQLSLRYRISQDAIDINSFDLVIDEFGEAVLVEANVFVDGVQQFEENGDPVTQTQLADVDTFTLLDGQSVVDSCNQAFIGQGTFMRDAACINEIDELTSLLGYTFSWSNTNNPFEPTRGFDFSISQDLAGLGGDARFLRSTATFAAHRGITKGVRATLRLQGGGIFAFGDDESLRINNRFFRGGQDFRGFNVAGLGPRLAIVAVDENGEATDQVLARLQSLGGQAFYQGTLEVTLPQWIPEQYGIRAALFAEVGAVGLLENAAIQEEFLTPVAGNPDFDPADPNSQTQIFGLVTTLDSLDLRATAGISISWDSPFGPIRFDFSQLITAPEFDRPNGFRFSTNTRF